MQLSTLPTTYNFHIDLLNSTIQVVQVQENLQQPALEWDPLQNPAIRRAAIEAFILLSMNCVVACSLFVYYFPRFRRMGMNPGNPNERGRVLRFARSSQY